MTAKNFTLYYLSIKKVLQAMPEDKIISKLFIEPETIKVSYMNQLFEHE